MEISEQLLRKYILGHCTEEEAQFIEKWLASEDDVSSNLREVDLSQMRKRTWEAIEKSNHASFKKADKKVVPLYKQVMRYAAVACVIIGVFVAGFSAGSTYAKPAADLKPKDLLHVYGPQGAKAQLTGREFILQINGHLRLHNESFSPKRIVCGEQEFTLEPHRTYYLSESDGAVTLSDDEQFSELDIDIFSTDGVFSIARTDD